MNGLGIPGSDASGPLEEAAAWRARLAEAGLRTSLEFEMWLSRPGNQAAWEQVARAWGMFDEFTHAPEMAAARQAALRDARRAGRGARLLRPLAGLAAMLLVALVMGSGAWWWSTRPDDYQTALGERRVVTLSDGSKLSLDSGSEVTVLYHAHERALHLLHGQARFDVAHDKSRPFSVIAGNQKVIATGTAFNIDMAGPKVLVTLIEGHVVVLDSDGQAADFGADGRRIELVAGQQLVAGPSGRAAVQPASVQRVTAWTLGQIMFDDETLTSVVERVNRYSNTQIIIADPKVGAMKISGVFNAGDAAGFVEIVTHYLPVKAVSEGSGAIALQGEAKGQGNL